MKHVFSLIILVFFINALTFSAFSFKIDGIDTGVEWDGATVYRLVDGESNCGVDFGVVKFKFDYENDALFMCYLFNDPDLTVENTEAGICLNIEGSSTFEVTAADGFFTENINPYSFDGSVFIDKNQGATCEIRVGFKSGLPEFIDCDVRFIDSQGFYSNHYQFVVVNEKYEPAEKHIISPTVDNSDPAYNPDANKDSYTNKATTQKKTTKAKTTKKSTTKQSTTGYVTTTLPTYSYSSRTSIKEATENSTTEKTTKVEKTQKETVKVIYYEKDIYISEVYISVSVTDETVGSESVVQPSTDEESAVLSETNISDNYVSLYDGTRYKKIITVIGLVTFIGIACFGSYSAKKSSNKSTED